MRMNKTIKFLITLLLVMTMMISFGSYVFAGDIGSVIEQINTSANEKLGEDNGVSQLGGQIVGIIQVIGIVVAVVILLVLGIKYMTGSAQEKAEYKKTMIPYIIGAILIFAASTIVNVIFNLATNIQV